MPSTDPLPRDPLPQLDYEAFARDLDRLRRELLESLGPDDYAHLLRCARIGTACSALGWATSWVAPNPISALLLAAGRSTRWAVVMHHVSHKALDRIPGVPEKWTSKRFAQGERAWMDWLDWISPDAWRVEHNHLHHYHTGEELDPDLVEHNLRKLRAANVPDALKYAAVAFYMLTWKLTYYAPSTFQTMRRVEALRAKRMPIDAANMESDEAYHEVFDPRTEAGREFWKACVLPYGLVNFVAAPLLFAPLGAWAASSALINSVMGELLTNLHTFLVIVPNHAGDDMHRFDTPSSDRPDFYVRQILGSVNFTSGSEAADLFHGYLNYQIEHHLWPDLPPSAYRRAAPRVREICEEHGVPYVEENVFKRCWKTIQVMVGKSSMQQSRPRSKQVRREATRAAESSRASDADSMLPDAAE